MPVCRKDHWGPLTIKETLNLSSSACLFHCTEEIREPLRAAKKLYNSAEPGYNDQQVMSEIGQGLLATQLPEN